MLPMLIGAGAGAGLGLLKSEFIDKDNENKDREMQSITDRYSPWTKMRGVAPEHTNPLGEAAAGAVTGAQQGQSIEGAQAANKFSNALADKLSTAAVVKNPYEPEFTQNPPVDQNAHAPAGWGSTLDVTGGGASAPTSIDQILEHLRATMGNRVALGNSVQGA